MLNVRLRITWPLLFALLLATILLIFRSPAQTATTAPAPSPRPRPMAQRARSRHVRRPDVIFKTAPDYDAETNRLDQEAAEAARQAYDRPVIEIKQPVWRNA